MPAETIVAAGWAGLTAAATVGQPGERGVGVGAERRHRHDAAERAARAAPRSRPRAPATAPGRRRRGRPAQRWRVERDLDQRGDASGRAAAAAARARRPAAAGRPSGRRRRSARPSAPCCAAAARRSASAGEVRALARASAAASWSRFSPTSVTPSPASSRTSEAGNVLVTAISVTDAGVAAGGIARRRVDRESPRARSATLASSRTPVGHGRPA